MQAAKNNNTDGYSFQNRVKLVFGGADFFSRLSAMIKQARHSVYLQFYIYEEDETGMIIAGLLREAAQRGVRVFLHVDGYASQRLSRNFLADLHRAGIFFKWFEPLFRSKHFYFGRRLHHKVVVVDGVCSLVAGINICDRYNDRPGLPAWLDIALYCEGEASLELHKICRQMWGSRVLKDNLPLEEVFDFCSRIPLEEYAAVRVRRNDWVKRKQQVSRTYLEIFNTASDNITIMCSYFLPGRLFRKRLIQAVNRGVSVKVILAGRSDVMIAKHAERYLYRWLLNNRIEIYEYQKTILHAKIAVCDHHLVTAGSYNVNNISAYASLELNLDVKKKEFALLVENEIEKIIRLDCKKITRENFSASNNFFRRVWQRFCYRAINNIFNLFTFYFKQQE